MAGSSAELHEPAELLGAMTIERHRATVSLMEELEAIDWYDQRIDATGDEALREILIHNRDEEKEHAVMALEWLRRHDPALDRFLRAYLFTEEDIGERAEELEGSEERADAPTLGGSLGIGSLRGVSR